LRNALEAAFLEFWEQDKNNKLLYVDANNLYGWAMMQINTESESESDEESDGEAALHDSGNENEIELKDIKQLRNYILALEDNANCGYFFEVDLDYPKSIKRETINFPYCPEKIFIQDEELFIIEC
jgi:uncharacterized protein with ParB-like and HNH nuclease domain